MHRLKKLQRVRGCVDFPHGLVYDCLVERH